MQGYKQDDLVLLNRYVGPKYGVTAKRTIEMKNLTEAQSKALISSRFSVHSSNDITIREQNETDGSPTSSPNQSTRHHGKIEPKKINPFVGQSAEFQMIKAKLSQFNQDSGGTL